jgi:cytochrome c-type biogenesis protein CcmH/NrfF
LSRMPPVPRAGISDVRIMTRTRIRPVPALALSLVTSLGLLLAAASPGAGQTPPPTGEVLRVHPEAKKAIDRIKSPYCPGEMLEVCPSAGGAMLRDSIQRMAEAGLSADSIVEIVVREYGEQYRAQPKISGTGLWAWVLPPAALLGGLGIVGVVLAHRRRGLREEATPVEPVDPEVEARLREAMKELDEAEEPVF